LTDFGSWNFVYRCNAFHIAGWEGPANTSQYVHLAIHQNPLIWILLLAAYAGSKDSPSLISLVWAILGLPTDRKAQMSKQERFDFCVVVIIFGALVAASVLSYYSQASVYNI
jgi:hypothetical protein